MKPFSALYPAYTATRAIHGSIESRSIDSHLFNNFAWMAQYAAAGYCDKDDTAGDLVTCQDSVCADVVNNGATVYATFDGGWEATGGLVIQDDVNSAIVVSFSGSDSDSVQDIILDIDILLESIDMCDGCQVHSGFHGAWNAMADDAMSAVQTLLAEHPTYSVTFTGHSLGAALATLGCAYWRVDGGFCETYTFGSPRVGNLEFVEFVSAQAGNEYRMTHLNDPVPRLPGHALGYYHTNMEYWLSDGTTTTTAYTADDVVVCTGYYNTSCNSHGIISLDHTAHSYYLVHISACS